MYYVYGAIMALCFAFSPALTAQSSAASAQSCRADIIITALHTPVRLIPSLWPSGISALAAVGTTAFGVLSAYFAYEHAYIKPCLFFGPLSTTLSVCSLFNVAAQHLSPTGSYLRKAQERVNNARSKIASLLAQLPDEYMTYLCSQYAQSQSNTLNSLILPYHTEDLFSFHGQPSLDELKHAEKQALDRLTSFENWLHNQCAGMGTSVQACPNE